MRVKFLADYVTYKSGSIIDFEEIRAGVIKDAHVRRWVKSGIKSGHLQKAADKSDKSSSKSKIKD